MTNKDDLPKGKLPFPLKPDEAPFKALERWLDVERDSNHLEIKREIRSQAIRQLEVLEEVHREVLTKAKYIIEETKKNLELHDVKMYSAKVRGNTYYLYERKKSADKFFSILEPEEYLTLEEDVSFLAAYRLNEDGTWTKL